MFIVNYVQIEIILSDPSLFFATFIALYQIRTFLSIGLLRFVLIIAQLEIELILQAGIQG